MGGSASCYQLEYGGLDCPGEMFGANAPASTWHMTFDHANLGPVTSFVSVPADSPFNSLGDGQVVAQPKKSGGTTAEGGNGGGNNGGGNGSGNGKKSGRWCAGEPSLTGGGGPRRPRGRRRLGPRSSGSGAS